MAQRRMAPADMALAELVASGAYPEYVEPSQPARQVALRRGYDDYVPASSSVVRGRVPYGTPVMSTTIGGSVGPLVRANSEDPLVVWAPRATGAEDILNTFLNRPTRNPDPRMFDLFDRIVSMLARSGGIGGGGGGGGAKPEGNKSTSTNQSTTKEGSAEKKPIIGDSLPSHKSGEPAKPAAPGSTTPTPTPTPAVLPPAPVYSPLTEGNTSGMAAVERNRDGGPKVGAESDPVIEGDTSGTAAVERNRDGGPEARTRFRVGSPGIPGEGAATGLAAVDRNVPHAFTRITPDPMPLSPSSSLAEASRIVEEMRGAPGTTPSRIRGAAPTPLPPVFFGPKTPPPPAPTPIIPMKPSAPLPSHPTARFRVGMPGIPGEGAASGLGSVYRNTRKQPR